MTELISTTGEILSQAHNFYLFLAVVGTVIFVIQFIMSLFGADGTDHPDTIDSSTMEMSENADIAELNFFSIKSIVAFITFFGWAGVIWGKQGWSGLFIAFGCGFLMMFMTALIIWLLLKMQQSGNINPVDMVGHQGVVYLSIPAGRAPGGKVTVNMSSCTREVGAMADEELKSGTPVVLESLLGSNCYLVRRADADRNDN